MKQVGTSLNERKSEHESNKLAGAEEEARSDRLVGSGACWPPLGSSINLINSGYVLSPAFFGALIKLAEKFLVYCRLDRRAFDDRRRRRRSASLLVADARNILTRISAQEEWNCILAAPNRVRVHAWPPPRKGKSRKCSCKFTRRLRASRLNAPRAPAPPVRLPRRSLGAL